MCSDASEMPLPAETVALPIVVWMVGEVSAVANEPPIDNAPAATPNASACASACEVELRLTLPPAETVTALPIDASIVGLTVAVAKLPEPEKMPPATPCA